MAVLRHVAPVAAILILLGAVSVTAPATAESPSLVWSPCGSTPDSRLECATLNVPLDYRDPGGATIELAISRLPASDPARRRGVLLTNPGGPGGSGLGLPEYVPQLLASQPDVTATHDVIGMDPRFVGRSTPATCGLTPEEMTSAHWPGPGGFDAEVARARTIAAKCARSAGAVLAYATTANVARDVDRIRAALGESKLSYLGYSYGTTIGRAYAALFPRRVDRFVLDSNVHPEWSGRQADRQWGPNFERMLGLFGTFASARNETFGLGTDPAAVRAAFDALITEATAGPIPSGELLFTATDIRTISFRLLYAENRFTYLGRFVATLRAHQPLPADIAFLADLRSHAAPPGAPVDNFVAAFWLVKCGDRAFPHDVERYRREFTADSAAYPFLGPAMSSISPCAFWPKFPREPLPTAAGGQVSLLLINSTGDPATPYAGALATRKLLPRSRLVTVPVSHHAVLGEYPNTCVEQTAGTYLTTGHLPRHDVHCPATPDPSTATAFR